MPVVVVNNGKATSINPGKQMDGSKIPGDLDAWDYMGTDPNDILKYSYKTLSERSTTLYHTHGPVAAAVNKQTNYAIGSGLVYRSQPDYNTLGITKEYAKEWGMRFQKLLFYTLSSLNWYEKQSVLFRTSLIMGDSLLLFDRKEKPFGMPFDLIEVGGDQIDYQKNEDNKITLGISHDKYFRRKGVNLVSGESVEFQNKETGDQNIVQFYLKLMARQLRGYPLAYRAIAIAKNNDRLWDATLSRAVMETIILGTSTESGDGTDVKKQMENLASLNREQGGVTSPSTTSENIAALGSGNVINYGKGGGMTFTDLKTPGNNFDKLQTAYIDVIGMATDTPPEVVMSKYSTSFTAHKGAFNDFIMSYMQKRKSFEKNVDRPVIREVAKWLFTEGLIEMPHPAFFTNKIIQDATLQGNHLGPVPKHVNPMQEVQAKILAKDHAFALPSDFATEYGHEFDDMIEQWSWEQEQWQKMNPNAQATAVQDDINDKDEQENDDKEDENDEEAKEDEK